MPGKVDIERHGRIMVATVDNPPVNALSHGVRAGLAAALAEAADDPQVDALVIRCAGRTFLSGADIREFGKPMAEPQLGALIAQIAASPSPVVAAIHGSALGGGFEVALAAHYRIATTEAKVGLPEVGLGIIPGSGGTQRLPRLVGAEAALEMIVEGRPVPADRALELGAIDEISTGDLTEAAIALARSRAAMPPPRAETMSVRIDDFGVFDAWRSRVARSKRGQTAPLKAIEAVGWATSLPFGEALAREYDTCVELLHGPQSKALRHLFAARRAVARPRRLDPTSEPRPTDTVAVVGPGTMGTGIAVAFADAGIPVTLLGRSAAALERAHAAIDRIYASNVSRGRMSAEAAQATRNLISASRDYADLAGADLVIEAVSEDLRVKQDIFAALDRVCRPGTVLASNTSFLDLDAIASATGRPGDVVGMHFFNPAHVMPLLENAAASRSSDDALATAMAVGRRLGKTAVLVGSCEGFVANRMLAQRSREGLFLLEEGATPWQIDRVLKAFGFPMGPYELADLAGLDVVLATRLARFGRLPAREQACDILPKLVAAGRLGQKSGAGFYAYADRKPVADPQTEALIEAQARSAGIARREISDEEILERCLYAMINEGARLIEEGVVDRPHEIDVVWTQGFGFPAHLGGPMFHADTIGVERIRDRLARYCAAGSPTLAPAGLVVRLADGGLGFYDETASTGTAL